MNIAIIEFIGIYNMVLFALMVLDVLSGLVRAFQQKKVNSSIGSKGLSKKMMVLIFVCVAMLADYFVLIQTNEKSVVFGLLVAGFYSWNEFSSIVENATQIGLPVPAKLTQFFEKLKGDEQHD